MKDITWLRPDGEEMTEADWEAGWLRCLGVRLGEELGEIDERGELVRDDTLLVLLNAHHEDVAFDLPRDLPEAEWECLLDTTNDGCERGVVTGEAVELGARSVVLLRRSDRGPSC